MKNTKVLSLLFLMAFAQTKCSVNPQLSLVLANQVVQIFSDDVNAVNMLASMNSFANTAKIQKNSLAKVQGGTFTKGVPLNSATIATQDAQLEANIKKNNSEISTLKKQGNIATTNGSKIANRNAASAQDQKEINANEAAIAINALIIKAENAFVNALEAYIAAFGQCYSQAGTVYGSTIIISSKYDQNTPITACEYNQLITTLNNAAKVFGSSASISLNMVGSNQAQSASIQQVASYISNMAPAMTAGTKALYGAAALIGTAALAVAAGAAYNVSQGKDWNDTANIINSPISQQAQSISKSAYDQAIAAGQNITQAGNTAYAAVQNAYNSYFGSQASLTPAQETIVQNTIDNDTLAGINASVHAPSAAVEATMSNDTDWSQYESAYNANAYN